MIKNFVVLMMMAGFSLGLSGCNTMEGAGQDIERGGEKIEEEARENK